MESKSEKILKALEGVRRKDACFEDGKIFSSMCSKPGEIGVAAGNIFSDVNLLDEYLFPNAKKIENEVIRELGTLLGNQKPEGFITSGGSEGNLTALYLAKKLKPKLKKVLLPESAHYSLKRACDLMGLSVVQVPLEEESYRASVSFLEKQVRKGVLACVLTAGTTEHGVVDPIAEASKLCEGEGVFLHVDSAFGGFIIPFLKKAGFKFPDFDFRLPAVKSLTVDPHKMGLAPIPSGALIFRQSLSSKLSFQPDYLMNPTSTLFGTRPGGSAAAVWALLKFHGVRGYTKIAGECMRNALMLYEELAGLPDVSPVIKPELPIVCFRVQKPEVVFRGLSARGWRITLNREYDHFRLVVMPHIREEHILEFISDLRDVA